MTESSVSSFDIEKKTYEKGLHVDSWTFSGLYLTSWYIGKANFEKYVSAKCVENIK